MTPIERAAAAARDETGAYNHRDGLWMTEGGLVTDKHFEDIARAVLTAYFHQSDAIVESAFLAVMNASDRELGLPLSAWTERNLLKRRISVAVAHIAEGLRETVDAED